MTKNFDDVDRSRCYFAKCNGRFYRGARLFRWTLFWRRAAAMRYEDWVFLRDVRKIPWSTELLTLEQVVSKEK